VKRKHPGIQVEAAKRDWLPWWWRLGISIWVGFGQQGVVVYVLCAATAVGPSPLSNGALWIPCFHELFARVQTHTLAWLNRLRLHS
jgi:hypothetical protein